LAGQLLQSFPVKTKFKSFFWTSRCLLNGAVCAGAVALITSYVQAQNLFLSGLSNPAYGGDYIHEITPGGAINPFASELSSP
jgi:hypothetical protein